MALIIGRETFPQITISTDIPISPIRLLTTEPLTFAYIQQDKMSIVQKLALELRIRPTKSGKSINFSAEEDALLQT